MSAHTTAPCRQYTPPGFAAPTPAADPQAERLARLGAAACRRAVAVFDRRGLVGPADLWHRAALLAADPTQERGATC